MANPQSLTKGFYFLCTQVSIGLQSISFYTEATKEAMWMKKLLREIETRTIPKEEVNLAEYHEKQITKQWRLWDKDDWEKGPQDRDLKRPQRIMAENQGGIKLAENILSNSKAKHIEIHYHYVRDMWEQGKIELVYEPTATMTADALTKALPRDRHWLHMSHMEITAIGSAEQVGE